MKRINKHIPLEEKWITELGKLGIMPGKSEKELNSDLRQLSQMVGTINYGGCGAFAKLLYYALKKEYPSATIEILALGRGEKPSARTIFNSKEIPADRITYSWVVDHIVIRVNNNYCMDSDGIHTLKYLYPKYRLSWAVPIDISTLNRWVASSDGWNPRFSRLTIPFLAMFLKQLINIIKEYK